MNNFYKLMFAGFTGMMVTGCEMFPEPTIDDPTVMEETVKETITQEAETVDPTQDIDVYKKQLKAEVIKAMEVKLDVVREANRKEMEEFKTSYKERCRNEIYEEALLAAKQEAKQEIKAEIKAESKPTLASTEYFSTIEKEKREVIMKECSEFGNKFMNSIMKDDYPTFISLFNDDFKLKFKPKFLTKMSADVKKGLGEYKRSAFIGDINKSGVLTELIWKAEFEKNLKNDKKLIIEKLIKISVGQDKGRYVGFEYRID